MLRRTIGALLVAGVVAVLMPAPAPAGVDPADLCKDKKGKATGKKTLDKLKAYGKDGKTPNTARLTSDLSKAESRYQKSYSMAESPAGCETNADSCNLEADVDAFVRDHLCQGDLGQQTVNIPSGAEPAETPGTSGVNNAAYPKLVTMFGGTGYDLNNATYTRYYCGDGSEQPDAILVLIPGFEGGAASFRILAENTVPRARARGLKLEIWGFDRRGHQMEDLAGLDIAEGAADPLIALDWLFGGELGLTLHPSLSRRAEFMNTSTDVPFMANWTSLVLSRDIDAVIEQARSTAANQNVFLGGHSAGTGFTARYAATNFNLGVGTPDPGYAKVRGLVIIEGGGGSTAGDGTLTTDSLDRIEDRADGGLFYAVRDNAPRCVDGTACTVATESTDCAGKGNEKCTEPTTAYAVQTGLLNPRILATGDVVTIQAINDPDTGHAIIREDQGAPGNNAIDVVPDLAALAFLPEATAMGGLGSFIDDDPPAIGSTNLAVFVASSVGAVGPTVGGLRTWIDNTEPEGCPMPSVVLTDNLGPPTTLPATRWGQEVEGTNMNRIVKIWPLGATNFTDWYYPSAGLGTTSVPGKCSGLSGNCIVGNVPAACSGATQAAANAQCSQSINLDSTQLSVGRSRTDIENLTQAAAINVPVICFGGSNGLTTAPGTFVAFAQSIGTCTAPSCDGSTPRVVNASVPNPAFPTLGGVAGGFEAYISEGYSHVDIVVADDGLHNQVVGPLVDFLVRNVQ
jgi:pimeloyl-ACP methyl ester carboxylesterase